MKNHIGANYYSFGVSFRNAPAAVRQYMALLPEGELDFYNRIFPENECAGFVVNTCNRTTFFLHGKHPEAIETAYLRYIENRLSEAGVDFPDQPNDLLSRYIGIKAVGHLFEVCAGLDSQILGDFEIVGQVKRAFLKAKELGSANGMLEQAVNTAVFVSRKIKNETGLSSGSTSTSYATAKFLFRRLQNHQDPRVLVLGMGEIGHRTLDNWVAMHGTRGVVVANRTNVTAQEIASELGVDYVAWEDWKARLSEFDAVVSAISAPQVILSADEVCENGPKIFVDLSVPMSIDPAIAQFEETEVLDVDMLSKRVEQTLQSRASAVPQAYGILKEVLEKYKASERAQKAVPMIRQIQNSLEKQWNERKHDPVKIERLSSKIESRLFEHVRKDPNQVQQLKKWLRD